MAKSTHLENDSTKWAHIHEYINRPLNSATHLRILCSDSMSHSVTLRKWGAPSLRMMITKGQSLKFLLTNHSHTWTICGATRNMTSQISHRTLVSLMTVETTGVSNHFSIHPAATTCQKALQHNLSTSTISMVPRTNKEEKPHSR
jgi:hypothetical protein